MDQFLDFFRKLFDGSDWPPRWHCGRWSEFHGWLYIISDLLIWAAYFTIPIVILRYLSKKQDLRFTKLYFLFAAFIIVCGTTHFLDALTFWFPLYRLNALVKFFTAVISWVTIYYLLRILPFAFSLRSFADLEQEIALRKSAEQEVNRLNAQLEDRVRQKTDEIYAVERKFRSIIENSSEAISLVNESFEPLFSNNIALKLTGREQNGPVPIPWLERVHQGDLEQLKKALNEVKHKEGGTTAVSFRIKHQSGQYVWLDGTFKNMLDDATVNAIVCNFRDVTEAKAQEERRRLYTYIIDSTDDAVISKTLDGIITSWNNGAERIFGYMRDEVLGKHIALIIPPDRRAEDIEIQSRVLQGIYVRHCETQRITKSGAVVYILLSISPVRDESGNIIGFSKIAKDVTHDKIMKDQLVKSEKIYHTIAENLPGSLVTIIDAERNYVLAEGEGLKNLGYTREGLLGRSEKDGLSSFAYQLIRPFREQAFGGAPVSGHFRMDTHDYLMRFIPLKDEGGAVYAVMTISLDITDVKKAEQEIKALNETLEQKVAERTAQLEAANKELEAFSYSVSHDLRAPLRIINGYADILIAEQEQKLDEEGKRLLGVIMSNTRQMGVLIDALLNLSRLGRKELTIIDTDMGAIVKGIVDYTKTHSEHVPEFILNDLEFAKCDNTLIRHVWNNLVSNAIKYSANHDSPLVEINSEKREREVVYWVKDNGVGFNMAYSSKLFGVFQRLHKKSEFEGTGIGLALVQRIVTRHGGRVWADAEEGKGATFYFSLPDLKE